MSLEMSEHEICTRFKRNGGGRSMIAILAQVNAVDDEVICNILLKHEPAVWNDVAKGQFRLPQVN